MVYGRTGETALDDPCYEDLFAAAAALGQPVFIHPQIPPRAVRQASFAGLDPVTDLALATPDRLPLRAADPGRDRVVPGRVNDEDREKFTTGNARRLFGADGPGR
jgi:predicted TIM-barrel fold metal-dependent hydrolase